MKYTSSQAAKLLRKLKEEKKLLLDSEKKSRFYTVFPEENPNEHRPEYDYEGTQRMLEEIEKKTRIIKHALNHFNVSTKLPGMDITIDQALIYLPQLTARREKLGTMQSHLPRERYDSSGLIRSSAVEYELINYDLDQVKADYRKVSDELAEIQAALDLVNVTETFDIEM